MNRPFTSAIAILLLAATTALPRPASAQQTRNPVGSCGMPAYPREAIRYELEGVVRLRYKLAQDGSVTDAAIDKSSGWTLLDGASLGALRACTFSLDQAAASAGRVLKTEHTWQLEGVRNHPRPVPDSCPLSERFNGFLPFDRIYTNSEGVRVRFLVDANGQPHGVKAEDAGLPQDQVEKAISHIAGCRLAFDPAVAGARTDTVSGRVMFKFQ